MRLSTQSIQSREHLAEETRAFSDLVRTDGPRPGTNQSNRLDAPQALLPARLMDFVSLTKPEVLLLVLITTAAGGLMASEWFEPWTLLNATIGTGLVAAGTAALNHLLERAHDSKMRRTANRPLPAGRLTPRAVLCFGIVLSVSGTVYLAVNCNLLTSAIGLGALLVYLLLYTPLKRRSELCTIVGAVPGAAPILMGWTAVTGGLTLGAWILYAILFLWQFPHFLAIGWMYRDDYARARMLMTPQNDLDGSTAFRRVGIMSTALIVLSFFPAVIGMAGSVYVLAAALLGLGLIIATYRAASLRTKAAAKELLHATIIYLPILFLMMVLDKAALHYA